MNCQFEGCNRKIELLITLPNGFLAESCLIHAQGHKKTIITEVKEL